MVDTDTPRVLIVEARYYEDIIDQLVAGVTAELDKTKFDYERLEVPGVFEVPAAIRMALGAKCNSINPYYAGYIALGCVIRGETSHYDYVCGESSRALMNLSMEFSIALGFGILTCENKAQAQIRADINAKNKGGEAATACLRMMDVRQHFCLLRQ
ncbi:MAG: 6,7-dimethyl-8-ribityllumazine synthase [Rhodospirillaceae bacterium TMED8]|nr:6,7-dimethyl-8-ribityllumazine synthase [Magnetovibrio sp.]OUT52064.1 MAG: 6,7-dimethyl-8-ribityllumazine synthase [Rhodospirillaceae bacterium TMED8]|tara:strand:+ start:2961 stop:3428 length:468 start_codon:yes stop_codon:yes gene_type:complete